MEPSFWLERWEKEQIGFHQAKHNALLLAHWDALNLDRGDRVLVPLCGKSLDMHWLRDRGHPVMGVELSESAARAFFREAGLESVQRTEGDFTVHEGGGIEIWCGDIFGLTAGQLDAVGAVYDRAALVALPPEMRRRYARHLAEHLPRRVHLLTIAFEYDQESAAGPPFAVLEDEVRRLFEPAFAIDVLHRAPTTDIPGRFQEQGVSAWNEAVYAMRR